MDNTNIFFDIKKLKHCGHNVIIGKTVRIRHPEKVSIGDNVIIDDFCYISGEVDIGDYVHIANGCTLSASINKIVIKPFSGAAAGVKIFAGTSNYAECGLDIPTIPLEFQYNTIRADVTIEKFVLIGANTVVLPGVHILEGCTFAANIVVRRKMRLKAWHLFLDEQGKMLPRSGVDRLLVETKRFYEFKD